MGKRLGFGHTKALLEICGKPIIIHHLEQLKDYQDVRIVVGFGYTDVINTVLQYRKNVTFVFNHSYLTTNTLQSFYLGTLHSHKMVISLDGDLLVKPSDLKAFLAEEKELMGYIESYSDEPVYAKIENIKDREYVTNFNRKNGKYEWTGLMQIKKEKITNDYEYVYQLIENHLPIEAKKIDCREIDTPTDLKKAEIWAKKIFK